MRIPTPSMLLFAVLANIAPVLAFSTEESGSARSTSWIDVVKQAKTAVVMIETEIAQGSGFLVQSNGTIVTNHHVINDATQIRIKLENGEVFNRAYLLSADISKDLAILRIEGFDLPYLELANSNDLELAAEVMLLGVPLGMEQSVSEGVVSGLRTTETGVRVIQTSASANPGSSGGPLLVPSGQVVGVLSFEIADSENLNFAIPSNYVRGMLQTLSYSADRSAERVLESRNAQEPLFSGLQGKQGVLVFGYGTGETYALTHVELLNLLAASGVNVGNPPSEFRSMSSDSIALPFILDYLKKSRNSGLLYLVIDIEYGQGTDRMTLQCYDPKGTLAWEEEVKRSWGMSVGGVRNVLWRRLKNRIKSRLGTQCLESRTDPGDAD